MRTDTAAAPPAAPLACVPGAIPADERAAHFARLGRLLTAEVRERRTLPDGYAFRFDAAAFDDVARWVALERRCCPFLDFAIELAHDGGPLWVRLSGPPGTRELLDAQSAAPAAPAR